MRAVRLHAFGEPLAVDDVPRPEAGPDDVLVRVTRAAVNPLDVWTAAGTVGGVAALPLTLGGEGSGVDELGRRVVFRAGGLGQSRDGSYAEWVIVPAEIVVPIPDGVDDAQAAGLGVAGVTALDCLDLGDVGENETVLVLGASGGVGHLAAQLARGRGATVIGQTTSFARGEALRHHVDEIVVADADGLAAAVRAVAPRGVDVVLDCLAAGFTGAAVKTLARGGRIVLYGASAGPELTVKATDLYRNRGAILGYGVAGATGAEIAGRLAELLGEMAAGRLTITVAAELPLEEAGEAHRRIRAREAGGKILLVP